MEKRRKKISSRLTTLGLILSSFLGIIIVGTLLLFCPFSQSGDGLTFTEAFFAATSAVCVTGLSPVSNISSCLNLFGKIVLAILIEIGGLGLVTIVMFIAILLGFKISFGQRLLIKEALNQDTIGGVVLLLKRIVFTAMGIQLFGTILNFIDFFFIHHFNFINSLGFAVFHAISSFNNAGFDLFGSSSLINFSDDILLNLSTSLMIILGGIGFVVIFDVIQNRKFKKLSMHSKIVITTTLTLLIVGTILYKLFDWRNLTWLEAFFMSVTTRTAGFATVNMAELSNASIILTMVLMFVGASPASTGGGVKVTTLFTMVSSLRSFATGESETHAFHRKLSEQAIIKAFILTSFAFGFVIINATILSMIEVNSGFTFKEIVFETISAFGTAGLSLGITSSLSNASKYILCIVMFVGRLGPITFISLFNRNANKRDKDAVGYVEGSIIIG